MKKAQQLGGTGFDRYDTRSLIEQQAAKMLYQAAFFFALDGLGDSMSAREK